IGAVPQHGSAAVSSNGLVNYTPQDGFSGTDTFTYSVKDFAGAVSNFATVTVVVNRPTANDDFATTNNGNPVDIHVLANDTDPDGPGLLDPATVTVGTSPAHGTVAVNTSNG